MKRNTGRFEARNRPSCIPIRAVLPASLCASPNHLCSGHWLFQAIWLWIMHKCSEPHNGVMMPRVQNHDAAHATPRRQTPHGWVKGLPAPLAAVCLLRGATTIHHRQQAADWMAATTGRQHQGSHVDGRPGQHHHGNSNVNRPTGPQIHKQKSSAAMPHCFSQVVAQWRRKAHHLA